MEANRRPTLFCSEIEEGVDFRERWAKYTGGRGNYGQMYFIIEDSIFIKKEERERERERERESENPCIRLCYRQAYKALKNDW